MCSRGPYKRYTVDSNVDFPRRTKYRRRKQLCKEMDDQTRPDSNGATSSDILVSNTTALKLSLIKLGQPLEICLILRSTSVLHNHIKRKNGHYATADGIIC